MPDNQHRRIPALALLERDETFDGPSHLSRRYPRVSVKKPPRTLTKHFVLQNQLADYFLVFFLY